MGSNNIGPSNIGRRTEGDEARVKIVLDLREVNLIGIMSCVGPSDLSENVSRAYTANTDSRTLNLEFLTDTAARCTCQLPLAAE